MDGKYGLHCFQNLTQKSVILAYLREPLVGRSEVLVAGCACVIIESFVERLHWQMCQSWQFIMSTHLSTL